MQDKFQKKLLYFKFNYTALKGRAASSFGSLEAAIFKRMALL